MILQSAAVAASAAGFGAGTEAAMAAAPSGRRTKPFIETADGTQLFYRDWGHGEPVVFTHAWALSSDIFEYQMSFLAEHGMRCIAYDKRGHGRSSDTGQAYDFDTLADDLANVIDELDLTNVTLVGFSMAAGEVARYLTRHGTSRVARVVLTSPNTPAPAKKPDNPDGTDPALYESFVTGIMSDRPAFYASGLWMFFGKEGKGAEDSPSMQQWVLSQFMQASPRAAIECIRALKDADFRPDMASFTMPTLVIQGNADVLANIDKTGRKTVAAIPGSRLIVYEGGPHGLLVTERQRFNHDLLAFIRG
jgi:pimeloyl-ACP methyl ester carboxylesterase